MTVGKTFEQMFPTISGIKATKDGNSSTNVTPTLNRLTLQAQELKSYYDSQTRSARANLRETKSLEQRLSAIENCIFQFENAFQQTLDSESQQIGLMRVLHRHIIQARVADNAIPGENMKREESFSTLANGASEDSQVTDSVDDHNSSASFSNTGGVSVISSNDQGKQNTCRPNNNTQSRVDNEPCLL